MPAEVSLTDRASLDVAGIYAYLDETLLSPQAADRFLDELDRGVNFLRAFPEGRPLCSDPGLSSRGYRSFRVMDYVVIYTVRGETVHLLHAFHRSQDYAGIVLGEDR